jgi:hypothetical protein
MSARAGLIGRGVLLLVLVVGLFAAPPSSAQEGSGEAPTLSVEDRLGDRRYVTTGTRAYVAGTEDGGFPAMGFHTRGEMGGVWAPPIKLLDGIWFGIDDAWIGPATRFTSGYGHVEMELPGREGLSVTRTDFVPDGRRAVLFGLTFEAADAEQSFTLKIDAHSELMSAYPWGETNPSQTNFNLEDDAFLEDGLLTFREEGTPDAPNAGDHDWAAVVGSDLQPTGGELGDGFRGPVGKPEVCPPSPDEAPERCDDTAYGKGQGGQLRYGVTVDANTERTVWFAVAGSETGPDAALEEHAAVLEDPEGQLEEKVSERLALRDRTRLDLPGDRQLQKSIDWSKQNLADSVQIAEDLEVRETNAGENYPEPEGTVDEVRFLGAGFPDYQWLFGTDGEFTAFASVAAGQFGPIKDHLRALRDVSEVDNGDSGKVVHEVVTDGSVYFGSEADDGNTDETAKFPSAVALIWRWTGDDAFRDEMYGFSERNMRYIFRELDEDGDLWPEGLGNVEREGMGGEKLDNAVYTLRGLRDLADMARSKGDGETASWAEERADEMARRFGEAWWMDGIPQHADSLDGDERVQQRHWIGVTPMDVELVREEGVRPGLALRERANRALDLREEDCYGDDFGLFHTGEEGCDPAKSEVPAERNTYTLNTAIMAVAEGNYGRLGEDQQRRFTKANARLQLPDPDEQPGAMPEISPSPDYGRSIEKPLNERAMVLQAWGAYGTIWPVVHQHLGVRPDLGRDGLEVVPQLPSDEPISGENIRLGDSSVSISAEIGDNSYTTAVTPEVALEDLAVGHTVPRDAEVRSVTLNGEPTEDYEVTTTNRGKEVVVSAESDGEQTLVVETSE